MKPLPIGWKFGLWAAALAGIVLAIFAGGTYVNLYHEQMEAVDLELEAESEHLLTLDEEKLTDHTIGELVRFQPWLAIAIFDAEGKMARRSGILPESIARAALVETEIRTLVDATGESWRLKVARRGAQTFVIAYTLVEVREIVHDNRGDHLVVLSTGARVKTSHQRWVEFRDIMRQRTRR